MTPKDAQCISDALKIFKGELLPVNEDLIRKLRALVFGECSDENWRAVRDNWCRKDSIHWLIEKANKPLKYA